MQEKSISTETLFEGRLFTLERIEIEQEGGTRSIREVIRHPGAVAVVGRLPDGDFLFVRQYRKAVEQVLLEVVAGTLEPGEDPAACALREFKEETGYTARSVARIGTVYPSPGYVSERIEIYFAEADPEAGSQALDEDEVVEPVVMSAADFEACIRRGEVVDAKTLGAWLFFRNFEAGQDGA